MITITYNVMIQYFFSFNYVNRENTYGRFQLYMYVVKCHTMEEKRFVNDRIKNDNTYNYYHYNNQVKIGPQYKE